MASLNVTLYCKNEFETDFLAREYPFSQQGVLLYQGRLIISFFQENLPSFVIYRPKKKHFQRICTLIFFFFKVTPFQNKEMKIGRNNQTRNIDSPYCIYRYIKVSNSMVYRYIVKKQSVIPVLGTFCYTVRNPTLLFIYVIKIYLEIISIHR